MDRRLYSFAGALLLLCSLLLAPRPLVAAEEFRAAATVAASLLNVRAGPDTTYAVVTTIAAGAAVIVTGRGADCTWLHVELADGATGWLSGPQLGSALECGDLPIIPVTAAPSAAAEAPTQPSVQVAAPAPKAVAVASAAGLTAAPAGADCTLAGQDYDALAVDSPPTELAAALHPDLNSSLRSAQLGPAAAVQLHDRYPAGDPLAPQLTGLFVDSRTPAVTAAYQVFDWDWGCNCRGAVLTEPEVTALGVDVTPGETLYTPGSPRTIGDDYEALVLYATASQITLKFTREDNVVHGYTLHVNEICVEPNLLALYHSLDTAGRSRLPALRAGQPFGRSTGNTIQLAIRDNGQYMDPRSRANWWR